MSNGRTLRFGSYIDNILVLKALIKLTELIFSGVLAPKPRFSQKGRRNLFSRNPPYLYLTSNVVYKRAGHISELATLKTHQKLEKSHFNISTTT
jgi:hypothetical protein